MEFCERWPEIQERYLTYWNRENHDRPLISLQAPKNKQSPPPQSNHATTRERWLDIDYQIACDNWHFENTVRYGEAMPVSNPNFGPDYFAACYGTEIEFGDNTSWAIPTLTDDDIEARRFPTLQDNFYRRRMNDLTRAAAKDGKGRYLVGVTDLHPGADALVSMRGPEALCLDMVDYPGYVREGSRALFDGLRTIYEELVDITDTAQQGTTTWLGFWHPGRWYVTSCDLICLLSETMFEEEIVPELIDELDYFDASIFHLDGPDALRHLDRLLRLEKLKGIQWVYGAGQPTASHWLPVLKKIQNAGKCIHVAATPEELPILLDNLAPEGVMYNVRAKTEDDAERVMKLL